MAQEFTSKRDNEAELSLYRLMRLQNRDNSFLFRDEYAKIGPYRTERPNFKFQIPPFIARVQFRISSVHYPLETIPRSELLRTFWKLISTHYFKKLQEDELYRWNYVHNLFTSGQSSCVPLPSIFGSHIQQAKRFWRQLSSIVEDDYLWKMLQNKQLRIQDTVWLKRMFIQWSMNQLATANKTKKISKQWRQKTHNKNTTSNKHGYRNNSKQKIRLLRQEQNIMDEIIEKHCLQHDIIDQNYNSASIDSQIQKLEEQLRNIQNQNGTIISQVQDKVRAEELQNTKYVRDKLIAEETQSIEWLIHTLQEKQIAQSITKVLNCQRAYGQSKYTVHYDNSMNIQPQQITLDQMQRINKLRQTSLLKFYKTGVKSLYSYTCQNLAGFSDMLLNRATLSKVKDRDYLQVMKKGVHVNPQTKQSFKQFDVCHHCKFIYPPYLLKTCKFTSDKQAIPKSLEGEAFIQPDLSGYGEHSGRSSQRFVSKHRNCLTGYAKIDEEYQCGRKFCLSCLKDNYGQQWMKNNNGLCPFCQGVCVCTRCQRSEKIFKLKSYFISIGGSISKLQEGDLIDKLPFKKQEFHPTSKGPIKRAIYRSDQHNKIKLMTPKSKKIKKIAIKGLHIKQKSSLKPKLLSKKQYTMQEQTERWSSTTQKEIIICRRSSKRRNQAVFAS